MYAIVRIADDALCAGGGEGLFAVREIAPDTFISFYHGEVCRPDQASDNPCTGGPEIIRQLPKIFTDM